MQKYYLHKNREEHRVNAAPFLHVRVQHRWNQCIEEKKAKVIFCKIKKL